MKGGNRIAIDTEPGAVQFADGVWGMEIVRRDLPPHLSSEEHMGRRRPCACRPLLDELRTTRQSPVKVRGFRRACQDDQHGNEHWLSGFYRGMDIQLWVCAFCWRVQVRDVSPDILIDVAPDGRRLRLTPAGMERRKDDILGIYSGARPLGRVHL